MSNIELIINIPDTAYQGILNANNAGGNWNDDLLGVLCRGVANGTPLPKGHGRLIDEDQIPGDGGWDFSDRLMSTPTIIEAESEE